VTAGDGGQGTFQAIELTEDPADVSRARKHVRSTLSAWALAEHTGLAELIVNELVTNAICHGKGPIEVRLSYASCTLRAEVHDHGAGRPVRLHADCDMESGRGLDLVDALAGEYGGERGVTDDCSGPGKTVYVVVALTATHG
jgi:anti-sigma regulatory factor (Ser/Thr protein kinase)